MGGNLIAFRFAGHDVHGCDYGDAYAARGRELGLNVRTGGVEAIQSAGPFDLIILSHVLEHVTQPIELMLQVASLLKPVGICYVEVPGLMNLQQWYSGNILEYLQNAHRWHFTQATLEAVLNRAGMKSVDADQTVRCIATLDDRRQTAAPIDGPSVLAEIHRLESLRIKVN
jgi:2-polyprenyl-3-methyl-5-hydroxy-6-metoxy-1,4-benzoquinol methylase